MLARAAGALLLAVAVTGLLPGSAPRRIARKPVGSASASASASGSQAARAAAASAALGALLAGTALTAPAALAETIEAPYDSVAVVECLTTKCTLPFAACITNPKCLAEVACINLCIGKPDLGACQIRCGDIFDDPSIDKFNACALTQKKCVPQRADDGSYPEPPVGSVVDKFDVGLMDGAWYITAGQNPIFDAFDCQAHFFTATPAKGSEPAKLYGKLNWRITEPDGEFFTKQAIQKFVQTDKPGVLYNGGNDYLNYQDTWYILDYSDDFVLVYYRGTNDAWDGYGGAVLYTRESKLPKAIVPRVRAAAKKANLDFDKWTVTDNKCLSETETERLAQRAKYAAKVAQDSEKTLEVGVTAARQQLLVNQGNANARNQKFSKEEKAAVERLEAQFDAFRKESNVIYDDVKRGDVGGAVLEIEKDLGVRK